MKNNVKREDDESSEPVKNSCTSWVSFLYKLYKENPDIVALVLDDDE